MFDLSKCLIRLRVERERSESKRGELGFQAQMQSYFS